MDLPPLSRKIKIVQDVFISMITYLFLGLNTKKLEIFSTKLLKMIREFAYKKGLQKLFNPCDVTKLRGKLTKTNGRTHNFSNWLALI